MRDDPRYEWHYGKERPPVAEGERKWSGGPGAWLRARPDADFSQPKMGTSGLYKLVARDPSSSSMHPHDQPVVSRGHTREEACRLAVETSRTAPAPTGYAHGDWIEGMHVVLPHTELDDIEHAKAGGKSARVSRPKRTDPAPRVNRGMN